MALKPLEFFRKRQKAILASLAILAMFLFVVGDALSMRQGGGTSLGSRIRRWFSKEHVVASVQGERWSRDDLIGLAEHRRLTWRFLRTIQSEGFLQLLREVGVAEEDARLLAYPEFVQSKEQQDRYAALVRDQDLMGKVRKAQGNVRAQTALVMQYNPSPHSAEALIEFVYWRQQADSLGVQLSTAAIEDDLRNLASGRLDRRRMRQMALRLGSDYHRLLGWIADELRVMIVRIGVLGLRESPSLFFLNASPESVAAQITPADLWDMYKQLKSRLDVGIVPISVDNKDFLDRIQEPSEEELRAFFDRVDPETNRRLGETEPDPRKPVPGFAIPRKYRIQFLYGDVTTSDYYRRLVSVLQALDPWGTTLQRLDHYLSHRHRYALPQDLVNTLAGGVHLTDGSVYERPLPLPVRTSSELEAAQAAHLCGLWLGAGLAGSSGSPLALLPGYRARPAVRVFPQPLPFDAAGPLAIGLPLVGLLDTVARLDYSRRYEPFEMVASAIADELADRQRREMLEHDLSSFMEELNKYSRWYNHARTEWEVRRLRSRERGVSPFTPPVWYSTLEPPSGEQIAAAIGSASGLLGSGQALAAVEPTLWPVLWTPDSLVARFAHRRGFLFEGMELPRPRHELFRETGKAPMSAILKPFLVELEERYWRKATGDSHFDERQLERLILDQLTNPQLAVYQPQRAGPSGTLFAGANLALDFTLTRFAVYWQADVEEGRIPRFEEVRDEVARAWKIEKARALAREFAEQLAQQAAKTRPDGYRILRDREGYQEHTLARYQASGLAQAIAVNYTRAPLPRLFEYPPKQLLDEAFDKLREPGDTLVVADEPQRYFYVLVLRQRYEPDPKDPLARLQFDREILVPDPARQPRIEGQRFLDRLHQEKAQKLIEDQLAAVRRICAVNQDELKHLESYLRREH